MGLVSLLKQGLSEPEFNGKLVYIFKKIVGRTDFSDHFRKINHSLQKNQIQHECYTTGCMLKDLFNCMPVGQASDLWLQHKAFS